MNPVFDYNDYRRFLADYYEEQKRTKPCFSYQYFGRKAGFRTKTFLYKVMKGEKALSNGSILAVAQAMKLGKRETEYFEALVNFNQASGDREREFLWGQLQALGGNRSSAVLRRNQYTYFSQWYHAVVRELVTQQDFRGDLARLARSVNPVITVRQARASVQLLLALGLLQKDNKGHLRQSDAAITTGEQYTSLAVRRFQKTTAGLAAEALERIPKDARDISTLTVGVSAAGFGRMREEMARCRRRLAQIASEDNPADRVYQVNLQLFPVSALPKGDRP
jgi:uncharacterized protein (TIGR02147 family)